MDWDEYKKILEKIKSEPTTPKLAIMCGLPRAGKSTYVKKMQEQGWVRVCPDEVRLALHGHQFISEAEEFVWAIVKVMAKALLKSGHRVVIDATNTTKKRRKPWYPALNILD